MADTPDRVAELLAWWENGGSSLDAGNLDDGLDPEHGRILLTLAKLGAAAIRAMDARTRYYDATNALPLKHSDEELNAMRKEAEDTHAAYTATRQEICNA